MNSSIFDFELCEKLKNHLKNHCDCNPILYEDTYIYTRTDFNDTNVIVSENISTDGTKYITQKNSYNLYNNPNKSELVGKVNYIHNIVKYNNKTVITSTGTLTTSHGSLVFNGEFEPSNNSTSPPAGIILISSPTFASGDYFLYKNIKIERNILVSEGDRILKITYEK